MKLWKDPWLFLYAYLQRQICRTSKIKRNIIIPKILSYYSFACVFAMVRRKEKRENTFNYSNSVVLFNQSIDIRNQRSNRQTDYNLLGIKHLTTEGLSFNLCLFTTSWPINHRISVKLPPTICSYICNYSSISWLIRPFAG